MTPDLRSWISGRLDPLGAAPADIGGPVAPAAVLIALVERPEGYNVLLTRRADTLRRHKGQIALPGGRCDPGETAWTTALREAEEEIGLARGMVTLAGLSTPASTGSGFLITPVVGFVAAGFTLRPNPAEVAEIFETPFAFLMDPGNHEEHERTFDDGVTRRFYAMNHADRFIWGATAGILRELYRRLYGAAVA